ncbi:MAG: DMT family transporter [Acidimicrobiales bacterium]
MPLTEDAPPRLGLWSAVAAVTVWGASSVLIKGVEGLNGIGLACYRIWLGAVVVAVLYTASGGRITRRLLRASLWGGVAFTADLVLFFCAVQETSVANATIIGALQPLLVLAVANRLFGERARAAEIAWGAVAVGGTVLVVVGGDGGGANSLGGDALAVGALVAWTLYFVATKSARQGLSAFAYLTGMSLVAAVAVVPLPFLFEGSLGATDTGGWVTIVFIALVNGLLGHFLMSYAHGHVSLLTVSLLTLAIPVISAAAAVLVIDEPLTVLQVVGMAVVISALSTVTVLTSRHQSALLRSQPERVEPVHP